jgi:hypothetical protein
MKRAEKICASAPPKVRRQKKRDLRRARRREERRDPENAGTRLRDYTRGWSD